MKAGFEDRENNAMRKSAAVVFLFLCAGGCSSTGEGLGIGFIAGAPTGMSIEIHSSRITAVNAAVAWPRDSTYIHLDHVWHDPGLFRAEHGELIFYYGIGGRLKLWDNSTARDNEVSLRLPLGLCYVFEQAPFDIFAEIVPRVDIAPDLSLIHISEPTRPY